LLSRRFFPFSPQRLHGIFHACAFMDYKRQCVRHCSGIFVLEYIPGFGWFGTPDESFHISEHIITKAGSLMALFLISYVVLKTLPEVLDMIDGVLKIMRIEFHRLTAV
ncbi:MAG: hypothetical protein O8C63_06280, partial [Candidatus Methanoperedens sp.]|nr:hypothetical protein [Candidatus Methanoperedens sp.]